MLIGKNKVYEIPIDNTLTEFCINMTKKILNLKKKYLCWKIQWVTVILSSKYSEKIH